MKLFRSGLLGLMFSLLTTQCFGMEDDYSIEPQVFKINPLVSIILKELKTKDAAQTLQAEEFWTLMAGNTGMGSHFLGEFIGNAEDKDVCMVIQNLIKFGKKDSYKFYVCITTCTGIDGITPLNELIRYIQSEYTPIYELFLELLELIKTLDEQKQYAILNQQDFYCSQPLTTARQLNKSFLANPISEIVFNFKFLTTWD